MLCAGHYGGENAKSFDSIAETLAAADESFMFFFFFAPSPQCPCRSLRAQSRGRPLLLNERRYDSSGTETGKDGKRK